MLQRVPDLHGVWPLCLLANVTVWRQTSLSFVPSTRKQTSKQLVWLQLLVKTAGKSVQLDKLAWPYQHHQFSSEGLVSGFLA